MTNSRMKFCFRNAIAVSMNLQITLIFSPFQYHIFCTYCMKEIINSISTNEL